MSDMSDFNLLSVQRPDEEMLELMAGYVAGWWNEHKEQIMALKNVFNESCTMDQLGFIHDKASGKVIAASKIEWFNRMLEQEDI